MKKQKKTNLAFSLLVVVVRFAAAAVAVELLLEFAAVKNTRFRVYDDGDAHHHQFCEVDLVVQRCFL